MAHELSKYWFNMTYTKEQKYEHDGGRSQGRMMNCFGTFNFLSICLSAFVTHWVSCWWRWLCVSACVCVCPCMLFMCKCLMLFDVTLVAALLLVLSYCDCIYVRVVCLQLIKGPISALCSYRSVWIFSGMELPIWTSERALECSFHTTLVS